jgi:branched-chain amino acid aminotransferase
MVKIFFWEDHYFRLMASMRIMRMDIPMDFTMEFLEAQILKTASRQMVLANRQQEYDFKIDRGEGGLYLPMTNFT